MLGDWSLAPRIQSGECVGGEVKATSALGHDIRCPFARHCDRLCHGDFRAER